MGTLFPIFEGKRHIDREGNRLSDTPSYNACDFTDGVGRVMQRDGRWSFVDVEGTPLCAPGPLTLGPLSEGRAWFRPEHTGPFGVVDRGGTVVLEASYAQAGDFVGGVAPVVLDGKLTFIDPDGEVVKATRVAPRSFGRLTDGLLRVEDRSSKHRWVDTKGKKAFKATFANAKDFTSEGYAMAAEGGDRRGVIDREGSWVLEPEFWGIGHIFGGCAMVFPSVKKRRSFAWVRLADAKVI